MKLTYKIKDYRIKHNMSIRQLSKKSGVSKSQISAIENYKLHPTVYCLGLLAAALGCKIEDLYEYEL